MRAVLMRTRKGAPSLPSNGCRCSRGRNACKDTPELLLRLPALSTSTAASGGVGISVRKRMMPLIKLVHPDMFGQYPPDVASTNSKSLKDLNTLIDAAEALEAGAAGAKPANGSGSVRSPAPPPTVASFYSLTFFHHKQNPSPSDNAGPNNNADKAWRQSGRNDTTNSGSSSSSSSSNNNNSSSSSLVELSAELRFPPTLSSDPSGSLRGQLRRQLDGLLRRASVGYDHGNAGGGNQETEDEQARRAIGDGVRVREGGTEEAFYGEAFGVGRRRRRGGAPRDGIRTERASRTTNRDQGDEPTITSEELRKLTIEHAGDNHHVDPWDAGAGSGFFGGGLGGGGGKGARRFGGAEASSQARSRRVDDLLRSGRVQFAGVPVSREAAALLRLHQTLVKHFEHLELHDRGLWSTVVLVLRARSESYEVQVHSGGPVLVFPEKFSERSLVRFLSEVLLSYT